MNNLEILIRYTCEECGGDGKHQEWVSLKATNDGIMLGELAK